VVAIAGTAPWLFFLIAACLRLRSLKPRDDVRDSVMTLAWCWVAVPLLFFSVSESKLPGYILPIFPALAIIIGGEVERVWTGDRSRLLSIAVWITAVGLAGLGVGFMVYIHREGISLNAWQTALSWLPLGVAIASGVALAAHKKRAVIAGAAGVVLAIVLASVILLFPTLREEVSLKSLSLEAAAALRPGEKIGFYLKKEFAPVFYADGRVLCEPRRGTTFYALHQDMVADALATEPSLILITESRWLEGLENDSRFTTEFIAAQDQSLVLRVALKR
jgi:4-amino-4-deoxy-L-arabinose transferase-like glycosyltransferase